MSCHATITRKKMHILHDFLLSSGPVMMMRVICDENIMEILRATSIAERCCSVCQTAQLHIIHCYSNNHQSRAGKTNGLR